MRCGYGGFEQRFVTDALQAAVRGENLYVDRLYNRWREVGELRHDRRLNNAEFF